MAFDSIENNIQKTPNFYGNNQGSAQAVSFPMAQPNFTANPALERTPSSDSISLSTDKKGMSKGEKVGIGVAIAAVVGGAIAFAVSRGHNTKGIDTGLKQLAENIKFTPAKTIEEAQKFGKEHLGIKHYVDVDNLEVLNWIHEGIVKTSNKMKGKLRIPKAVGCVEMDDHFVFAAMSSTDKKLGNILNVNKFVVDNMDNCLETGIKYGIKIGVIKEEKGVLSLVKQFENGQISEDINNMLNQFKRSPDAFAWKDKANLYQSLRNIRDAHLGLGGSPFTKIKQIIKTGTIQYKGNSLSIKDIEKMNTQDQAQILAGLVKHLGGKVRIRYEKGNIFEAIFHEMGHLQHEYSAGANYEKMGKLAELKNAKIKDTSIADDFLKDKNKQQIAYKISAYAAESPSEFVAEVFAKLTNGSKLSDDVMTLYEKYHGPKLA